LYELPQLFERSNYVKASCGYAGLRNLSNTCYLNSLLAQLFMNVDFRQFMCRADTENIPSKELLFETQKLFAFMQATKKRCVDPESFVSLLRNVDKKPIDVNVQMDVEESYNMLFDNWERQFSTAEGQRQLRSFYRGRLVQQVCSKECEHVSERTEDFAAIQCDIKGKGSLLESLESYVDGELMEAGRFYAIS